VRKKLEEGKRESNKKKGKRLSAELERLTRRQRERKESLKKKKRLRKTEKRAAAENRAGVAIVKNYIGFRGGEKKQDVGGGKGQGKQQRFAAKPSYRRKAGARGRPEGSERKKAATALNRKIVGVLKKKKKTWKKKKNGNVPMGSRGKSRSLGPARIPSGRVTRRCRRGKSGEAVTERRGGARTMRGSSNPGISR